MPPLNQIHKNVVLGAYFFPGSDCCVFLNPHIPIRLDTLAALF